jgi:cellulose synthase/poly-beta-1,6-N-acetylglucosamine synthase-like glycosyltransferase
MTFVALCTALTISAISQFLLVAGFVRRLRQNPPKLIPDDEAPPALIVLCLRGGDPFLERCINGLLQQDYPNFHVCFVVDSVTDPANTILRDALAQQTCSNYEVQFLESPLNTCSLKCSCLASALESRSSEDGFVALLDADTIPHPSWLRELATALVPPDIGAATGNRWYMPDRVSTGSMVRHVWNGAAVVQMYWYRIAWGGTLAIKWDSIRRAKLLDRWRTSLCEDTMLCKQLRCISQKVAFVPSLMMVNREDCSLRSFYEWVKRQLLTAKLYHPLWFAVVGHGFSSAVLLLWGWIAFGVCVATSNWTKAVYYMSAMLIFHLFLTLMLPWIESAVRVILRRRNESEQWRDRSSWWSFCGYVWMTQWVYTAALLACLRLSRVTWRGIDYDVQSAFRIRMLGYMPYASNELEFKTNQSL